MFDALTCVCVCTNAPQAGNGEAAPGGSEGGEEEDGGWDMEDLEIPPEVRLLSALSLSAPSVDIQCPLVTLLLKVPTTMLVVFSTLFCYRYNALC